MDLSRIRALRGPNLWSKCTAIEAVVECAEDARKISSDSPLWESLSQVLPEAMQQLAAQGDATPAHVLAALCLQLQRRAGCPVQFSRVRQTPEAGVVQVVVEYSEEDVGRQAIALAHGVLLRLQQALDAPTLLQLQQDVHKFVAQLRELDEDVRLGPSTGSIVEAARRRGIPVRRLTQGSLVQFGWGSRQRRIQAAESDRTDVVAEAIAQDKEATKLLLEDVGVPVPAGRSVRSLEEAWALAQSLGCAVVVKPRDGNQGKGVAANISTYAEIKSAFEVAQKISAEVIVERFLPGDDFRLLVVGDRLIAAAHRAPPHVIGDGKSSVAQLVDVVNRDPRRGDGHATALTRIRVDALAKATLEAQGLTLDSVPAHGQRVILRNNANLSTGGTATDVTDLVHPQLAEQAVLAARTVGLDICGVDAVCETVTRPLEEQGGGIVEVNAAPGLRMHLQPSYGQARAVGEAIIDAMFEPDEDGRIPVVAVTGTNGKTTTVKLIAHMLSCEQLRVGMTGTDGVYIEGRRIDTGDCSGPRSARNVLQHPDVDAAVLESARGGMLREGLGFDRCDVAVVTNIGEGDHLGLNYIETVEELAAVKQIIVNNVSRYGSAVLNAADPLVAAMASACEGDVIFFASDASAPVLAAHRAQGRRCVYRDGDAIVAWHDGTCARLMLADIPLTGGGVLGFQVENAMAAIGAAWSLGLQWSAVRNALRSFVNDDASAPGRFNRFTYRGATVIADYGHNPDAMLALAQAVKAMPANRRSVVISGAGDRRDADLRRQTEILGAVFEHVVLYEDQCQRGRADGEVLALLRAGLAGAARTTEVHEVRGEMRAIDLALDALEPGDVCLILVDQVDAALAHIKARVAEGEACMQ